MIKMSNLDELISYTNILCNGLITKDKKNNLLQLIGNAKNDFITGNIESEPLNGLIKMLKLNEKQNILKSKLNELVLYFKANIFELYANIVLFIYITQINNKNVIKYKYTELNDLTTAKVFQIKEKDLANCDMMKNARYIVFQNESYKYLMNGIDAQNKTVICIESLFPNPLDAYKTLYNIKETTKSQMYIYGRLFEYIIDVENQEKNAMECITARNKILTNIISGMKNQNNVSATKMHSIEFEELNNKSKLQTNKIISLENTIEELKEKERYVKYMENELHNTIKQTGDTIRGLHKIINGKNIIIDEKNEMILDMTISLNQKVKEIHELTKTIEQISIEHKKQNDILTIENNQLREENNGHLKTNKKMVEYIANKEIDTTKLYIRNVRYTVKFQLSCHNQSALIANEIDNMTMGVDNLNDIVLILENLNNYSDPFRESMIDSILKVKMDNDKITINICQKDFKKYIVTKLTNMLDNIIKTPEIDDNNCCICFITKKNIVFFPCLHNALCYDCAHQVTKCPICRIDVKDMLEIFN